ncbi:DUF4407 domain-containing protein [Flavihumibacter rivuli]|uniref:DUF4407 domain-containing protein n=1 Tax=Flavihumibacter rivuli TaxID=2838156 RepID=UPI001BDE9314|nr:DUF4407 domain-containing protein [Flavihumibacter rivuli]ULQ57524.1 DUF4407 domain-containing protein [Flavihumibacter rivuli]
MAIDKNGRDRDIAGYDAFSGSSGDGNNFLWWCAGAHTPLLKQYPTEQNKYAGLGGVLLATFVLAALSSGYAFYTIFGNALWAVLFAMVWGLIIFNFDRFLVSTIRKYGISPARQWRMAIPRILLAVMIGITIARPLELKLFEKEINTQVEANIHTKVQENDRQLQMETERQLQQSRMEKDRILARKQAMEDTLLLMQQAYLREADGTGGSGQRGIERITRLKMDAFGQTRASFANESAALDSALAYHNRIITSVNDSLEAKRVAYALAIRNNIGFLERNKALQDLNEKEPSVFWSNLFISLLIILLETAPIIAKMMLPVGPYDIALAQEELVPMSRLENTLEEEQQRTRKFSSLYRKQQAEMDEALLQQTRKMHQDYTDRKIRDWEEGKWERGGEAPLTDLIRDIRRHHEADEE